MPMPADRESRVADRPSSPRFQAACMPTPSSASSGSIGTRKTSSKYGGPTEIFAELERVHEERVQRAEQDQAERRDEQRIVEQQEALARGRLEAGVRT